MSVVVFLGGVDRINHTAFVIRAGGVNHANFLTLPHPKTGPWPPPIWKPPVSLRQGSGDPCGAKDDIELATFLKVSKV